MLPRVVRQSLSMLLIRTINSSSRHRPLALLVRLRRSASVLVLIQRRVALSPSLQQSLEEPHRTHSAGTLVTAQLSEQLTLLLTPTLQRAAGRFSSTLPTSTLPRRLLPRRSVLQV